MGAQKLRTPKGLDWIRSRYPTLSQVELLVEMQHLRHMFGALWAEAVHEVVSAEDSAVKFIVTDHPVTTFNAVLPEDAAAQAYPNDAPITWNGTQTLFPLDRNHLLVMTHVGYALNPGAVELAAKRTNARYFGNAMMRTDRLIRGRRFSTEHVIAVNAWLKRRAHRYVAAGKPEWLYPERELSLDHDRLADILRPSEKDLWHYGGETYIGFDDGTCGYRDSYGRTSREYELVAKTPPLSPPERENACPCGSDQAYSKCCEIVAPWERPPWDVLSLRERNLGFLRAIVGVLELNGEGAWNRVQRTLSDEQVARLHRISQGLWPENTDLTALLPKPGDGRARAVYMGPSDPRTCGESIMSLVPLFDQILVMDPFLSARNLKPEFSPVASPAQHKLQFLKNIWFWILLEPLIVAGKVLIFPDPGDLNPDFQRAMYEMAKARTVDWKPTSEDIAKFEKLARDDFQRSLLLLPDDKLLTILKKNGPAKPDSFARKAISYMRSGAQRDPMALLQVIGAGERLSQAQITRSVNLEVGLFIAQSTGAIPITDLNSLWNHLHEHTRAKQDAISSRIAGSALRMPVVLNPADVLSVSELVTASAARSALREVLQATQTPSAELTPNLEALAESLNALTDEIGRLHNVEPAGMLQLNPSIPALGFELPTVERLVVGFGRGEPPVSVGLAFFRRTPI